MDQDSQQQRLSGILTIIVLVAAFGLAGYWIWTQTGPFAWLMSLQGNLLGDRYYPTVTALLVLVIAIIPVAAVKLIFTRRDPEKARQIEHLFHAPEEALSRETIVVGQDTLIGWPRARSELTANGVTFRRGSLSVSCPWSVFGRQGQPFRKDADTVVLPIEPQAAPSVQATRNGKVIAEGSAVNAPFFKFMPNDQVQLALDCDVPVEDLAGLFLGLGATSTAQPMPDSE